MTGWEAREAELRAGGWDDAEVRDYKKGWDSVPTGAQVSLPTASLETAEAALPVAYRSLGARVQEDSDQDYLEHREATVGGAFRSLAEPATTGDDVDVSTDGAVRERKKQDRRRAAYRETREGWTAYARRALAENGDAGALQHNELQRELMVQQAEQRSVRARQSVTVPYEIEDDGQTEQRQGTVRVETDGPMTGVTGGARAIEAYIQLSRPEFYKHADRIKTYPMTRVGEAQLRADVAAAQIPA